MDRNTFSHYGWIVIVIIIICILIGTATPFARMIRAGIEGAITDITAAIPGNFGGMGGDDDDGGKPGDEPEPVKLPKPILSIEDGTLVISTDSPDVQFYAITVNGVSMGTVTAVLPDTLFDVSGLVDEENLIGVIAKGSGVEDSDEATITYVKASKLAAPTLSIEGGKLIISGPDNAEDYEITIDGVVVGTILAEHPETEYDLPEFGEGEHIIDVVAKATGSVDSDKATIVYEKLNKPVVSAANNTLTITGPEGAERYEIFVNGASVGTIDATSPSTKYDLSGLELGDHEIAVVAKAAGKYDSDPVTTIYKQRILAIGKTDPSYVLATYSDDYSSVTITKNGAESDGLMKVFTSDNNLTRDGLTAVTVEEGVKNVSGYAFSACQTLVQATLPEGLESMGSAFRNCRNLTTINLPTTLKRIEGAFLECNSLLDVTLPEGLEVIGSHTFFGCRSLTEITVPSSVTTLSHNAFKGCGGLKSITLNNYMTEIMEETFSGCDSLESIVIPNGVKTISNGAFLACGNLKSVVIPEGVETIKYRAFYRCGKLESLSLPSTVKTIGAEAFEGCSLIPSVDIPSGVTAIADRAFAICGKLKSVNIPDTVTSIGNLSFYYCSSLTSINIPASVTSIGEDAFITCPNLTTFNFEAASAPAGFENSGYVGHATLNFNVAM